MSSETKNVGQGDKGTNSPSVPKITGKGMGKNWSWVTSVKSLLGPNGFLKALIITGLVGLGFAAVGCTALVMKLNQIQNALNAINNQYASAMIAVGGAFTLLGIAASVILVRRHIDAKRQEKQQLESEQQQRLLTQQEIGRLTTSLENKTQEIEQLKTIFAERERVLTNELNNKTQDLQNVKKQIGEQASLNTDLQTENEHLKETLKTSETVISELQEQMKNQGAILEGKQQDINKMTTISENQVNEIYKLQSALKEKEKATDNTHETEKKTQQSLREEIENKERSIQNMQNQLTSHSKTLTELKQENEKLQSDLSSATETIKELKEKGRLDLINDLTQALESKDKELKERDTKYNEDLSLMQQEIDKAKDALEDQKRAVETMRKRSEFVVNSTTSNKLGKTRTQPQKIWQQKYEQIIKQNPKTEDKEKN